MAKSRVEPREARLETPAHGKGKLKRGGVNPGSGRPKEEFKAWCRSLLDASSCRSQVEAILEDKSHPAFKAMWAAVADRAHGKPTEKVEHTGEITHGIVILPAVQGK